MIYRRLLEFVRPYWKRLCFAFACMVLYSLFNTAVVWVLKFVVKIAFVSKSPTLYAAVPGLIFVTFLMRGLADYGQAYSMNWVGLRVVTDLRDKLYRHLHFLPLGFFSERKTGQLISRVTQDTMLVQNSVSTVLTDMVKQPLTLIGLILTLFYFDAFLASMSLFIFPLTVYPIVRFGKKVKTAIRKAQAQVGDITSIIHETLTGLRVVKAFGMEEYEISRFGAENGRFFKSMMDAVKAGEMTRPVIEIIGSCGAAFCFWYGAKHLSLDTFLSFMTALYLLYEPLKKLGKLNSFVQQASAAGTRIFEILDAPAGIMDVPGARQIGRIESGVRFSGVWFRYDSAWVLEDINFEMRSGEITALVGPSGSGKSTLANLIVRFYDPQKGAIEIDGCDLRTLSLKSLRAITGVVTQDVILFNDTVKSNIAYGRQDVSDDLIWEAARAAHAHEFITEMPKGYDTIVGEKGVKLSGGQRQRLAIARALLKNPRLLVLDEATSALDTESERLVQEALAYLMEGRTVLVIAHRLSTVRNAHKIVVLNEGRIMQSGTHDELIEEGGLYKRLYDVQFSA